MAITNQQLREAFLSSQMKCYFAKKLTPLPRTEVAVRIEETLKFLNIATYFNCNIPVSKEIDEVWHYWILETMEYETLCSKLHGRTFIHHRSNTFRKCRGEDVESNKNELEQEVAMLATYVLNYGPFEHERVKYWLFAAHLVEKHGWSVDRLNNWLTSQSVAGRMQAKVGAS